MEMATTPTQPSVLGRLKLGAATQSKKPAVDRPMINEVADVDSGDGDGANGHFVGARAHSMQPRHEVHHQREQEAAELLSGALKEEDVLANVELRLADNSTTERAGQHLNPKVCLRRAGLHRTGTCCASWHVLLHSAGVLVLLCCLDRHRTSFMR